MILYKPGPKKEEMNLTTWDIGENNYNNSQV